MAQEAVLSGRLPAELGNAVSDALHAALSCGMEVDEAACIVATVAADYARLHYGDSYLSDLACVVTGRAGQPLPNQA